MNDLVKNSKIEQLKRIIAEEMGLPLGAVSLALRRPLDHQSNRLYDVRAGGRRLILKEYLKVEEFEEAPRREFRALKLMAPLDIAPQAVFYRPTGLESEPPVSEPLVSEPLVAYEYMAGEMWDRKRPTPGELAHLAELWLQVNSVTAGDLWFSRDHERAWQERLNDFRAVFRRYGDWAAANFTPGQRAADQCLALLEKRAPIFQILDAAEPPLRFCRADARFANIIGRPNRRLGLVDWEDSGLGDPAVDLADIITGANQEDLLFFDAWSPFLVPYTEALRVDDPDLLDRLHLYLAIFPIFWLAILLATGLSREETGELGSWRINSLDPNERIRRYLARGLAWPEMSFERQLERLYPLIFFPKD